MLFAKVTQKFPGMDGKKVRTFKPGEVVEGELAQTAIDNHVAKEVAGAEAKKLQAAYDKKAKAKKAEAAGDDSSVSGDTGSVEEVEDSEVEQEADEESDEEDETDQDDENFDELQGEAPGEGADDSAEVEEPADKPKRGRAKR